VLDTVNSVLGDGKKFLVVRTYSTSHRRADEGKSSRHVKPAVLYRLYVLATCMEKYRGTTLEIMEDFQMQVIQYLLQIGISLVINTYIFKKNSTKPLLEPLLKV